MAFWIRYCRFKYQVMSFGLTNVSISFQGHIKKMFTKKLNIFVIVQSGIGSDHPAVLNPTKILQYLSPIFW